MTAPQTTLDALARALNSGRIRSRDLVEACLSAIEAEAGEGARTFVFVDSESARAQADATDRLRVAGVPVPPHAGIPISIKDLFDVEGQVTAAGSAVLAGAPAAKEDAPSVARLRRAGFVLIGRTNMSEFAFSGLGLNPHHGTPTSPWDRATGRVSGGSSSGAAISVADGMAHAALGTDTGGSCRIPAAFTGLVGFKPTAARVPLEGALPLAPSLDSVGPIARSVRCCMRLDAILADAALRHREVTLADLRLAVPTNYVMAGLDETVGAAFVRALSRLSRAGARVEEIAIPALDDIPAINRKGGFAAAEAYAWHRALLESSGSGYDPRIRTRIERGGAMTAADYLDLLAERRRYVAAVEESVAPFDAVLMPTVPVIPPRIADLIADEDFGTANLLALRNPTTINLLDGCAISIPIGTPGEAPVGLTVAATRGRDEAVLRIAEAVEMLLRSGGTQNA